MKIDYGATPDELARARVSSSASPGEPVRRVDKLRTGQSARAPERQSARAPERQSASHVIHAPGRN